jgi:hypothetical protein
MIINFPSTKDTKDAIRLAIGQMATFVIQGDKTACPTCSGANLYDGVNETSLDSFCPVCSGAYWITNDVSSGVLAHVRWGKEDYNNYTSAGEIPTGNCSVTININDLSNEYVSKIKYIIVDNRQVEVTQTVYRGIPTRDRIRFVCAEVGRE